ncbi:hypothetical protein CJF32_00009352 [Rutstroemia sp. NJR-2017a WRK4]|nr:hypothetical protein CJF32_00009352 [Rutstroemia sp. NJR-2017a WRK4]
MLIMLEFSRKQVMVSRLFRYSNSDHQEVVIPIDPGPLYFLKVDHFMCHRKQNDSIFGPRNEVYWSFAAGTDGGAQKSFKTGEYGEVESGDVRQMNIDFFEGVVHGHLGGLSAGKQMTVTLSSTTRWWKR